MIGDTLRREREKQNLTIKDIEQGTSIRSLYIDAIETGEYQTLPGEVYTKGFIRNYANFLKLDPDACVEQYLAEKSPADTIENEINEFREAPVVKQHRPKPTAAHQQPSKSSGGGGSMALVAASLLLIVGGAFVLLGFTDDKTADRKTARPAPVAAARGVAQAIPEENESEKVVLPSSSPSVSSENAAEPVSKRKAAASSDVEIVASFTDQCWTRVVADGQVVYEGIPSPGNTLTWTGKDSIAITMGNAGAIELTHNGQRLGKAGNVGQVVDKVFTRSSVN